MSNIHLWEENNPRHTKEYKSKEKSLAWVPRDITSCLRKVQWRPLTPKCALLRLWQDWAVNEEPADVWNWFFKNVKMLEVDIC